MANNMEIMATIAETSTSADTSVSDRALSVTSESNLLVPGKLHADIICLKSCYSAIIKELDPNKSANENNGNAILMLDKKQMQAGMKKHQIRADVAKAHLINLLDCVRPVCLPSYEPDPHSKHAFANTDLEIASLSSRVESLCSQNKEDFDSLKSELNIFKSALSSFESYVSRTVPAPVPDPIPISPDHIAVADHQCEPLEVSVDNYLPEPKCNELLEALKKLTYIKGKGRSTAKFGEHYTYNGSREECQAEFPAEVKSILDSLNRSHVPENVPLLNSCVVTRYSGPHSHLPEHSDDERSIHPESCIYTVSVGEDGLVRFRDKQSGSIEDHTAKHGSLYSMSRKSQNFFKHRVEKNPSWSETSTRFSLTFRSVHWRNNNSTIICGDSNTGGLKFSDFGVNSPTDHNGTFGNAMPGKQVNAFTIDELDPVKCAGYNNIVIHCGINDFREESISSEDQMKEIYIKFKSKISGIIELNKRARIFVSTVLPTKLTDVNRKVKIFNSFINDDLIRSFEKIKVINNHHKFSTPSGMLSPSLSREYNRQGQPDYLHINVSGICLLAQ